MAGQATRGFLACVDCSKEVGHLIRLPQVRHLSKLTFLSLGKNRLRDVPAQLKHAAPTLVTLDLSANRLASFPPAVLTNLRNPGAESAMQGGEKGG